MMTERPQRISYFPLSEMDYQMMAVMNRCAVEGTPRPESSAVRAHSQVAFWAFDQAWDQIFRNGVVDHAIKELCRVYLFRSVKCEYCGNQRSEAAQRAGVSEGKLDDLLNFETSGTYSERERAALSYAEAITWRLDPDERFWERLYTFLRGGVGRTRVFHIPDDGPTELDTPSQHRPSRGDGG